ncbi:hypothetical protein T484DRAFT_1592804, partial [Baffinella frigidus]
CTCLAGYIGTSTGTSCTACIAGTYKSMPGTGECLACVTGTYNNMMGLDVCWACPVGTSSAPGSDSLHNCTCLAGYRGTSTGAPCTACGVGTNKAAVGTGDCVACMAGTYNNMSGA